MLRLSCRILWKEIGEESHSGSLGRAFCLLPSNSIRIWMQFQGGPINENIFWHWLEGKILVTRVEPKTYSPPLLYIKISACFFLTLHRKTDKRLFCVECCINIIRFTTYYCLNPLRELCTVPWQIMCKRMPEVNILSVHFRDSWTLSKVYLVTFCFSDISGKMCQAATNNGYRMRQCSRIFGGLSYSDVSFAKEV